MSEQNIFKTSPANIEKWLRIALAVAVVCTMTFFGFVAQANADGGTRLRLTGIGYVPGAGDCTDTVTNSAGLSPDFATLLEGDLQGCQYVFVEDHQCWPNGLYIESGTEIYILDGPFGQGTFETTYRFQAVFEGCSDDGFPTGAELYGGCVHPIVAGTGTDDYEGVTGGLVFKDDVVAGNFPYRADLRW